MSLTKAQRAERRERVLEQLRRAQWGYGSLDGRRRAVTLELQRGRRRPRVRGKVVYVATTGAFVLLADDDAPVDAGLGERGSDRLHVPVDSIRAVHTRGGR